MAKIKITNQKRYGCDHGVQHSGVKAKIRATVKDKYGVDSVFQVSEIRKRAEQTMLERYGVAHAVHMDDHWLKIHSTNQIRYGVDWSFQAEGTKNKIKATMLERYGVTNPGQSEEFRRVAFHTSLGRYGHAPYVSGGERLWLSENSVQKRQVPIQGYSGATYFVDGIKDNVIYEYFGVYWHGHPRYFDANAMNKNTKTTFGELYVKTIERINDLRAAGFDIIAHWEDGTMFKGDGDE